MTPPDRPIVSIIIVNYNTPELVRDCVASIREYIAVPHEIIVVESGVDRPVGIRECTAWGALYLAAEGRRKFGEANNLGARRALGRYLWLLNSDTFIPDTRSNGLFTLLDHAPEFGIVSPVLFSDPELHVRQPDFYAHFQRLSTLLTRRVQPAIDWAGPPLPPLVAVDLVVAAAVVVRADLFNRLGGFDERIDMYMEDDDLCRRAYEVGALTGIATGAAVVHLKGRSIDSDRMRKRLYYASQDYYWRKHHGRMAELTMRLLRFPWRMARGL